MKSVSLILLVLIIAAVAVLISFMGSLSTYATVQSARQQPGTFVHLVARLDRQAPLEYDALKNPNYLRFTVVDAEGHRLRVVYRNAKPADLEISERLVLKGVVKEGYFECGEIVMKCPSKYKETGGSDSGGVATALPFIQLKRIP